MVTIDNQHSLGTRCQLIHKISQIGNGITRIKKDLTAERLGATTKLIEVNYDCYADDEEEEPIELEVVSFTFIEGEKEFAIAAEVIAAYNQKVLEEQA